MTTNFPTSLQDLDATRGTSGQPLSTPNHITHHTIEDDTIEALQAKVGVDNSAVVTSLDYLVKNTSSSNPGHKHTLANGATDVTASAAELNILDGATLSTAELNYVDGVTSAIQTQLNAKVNNTGNETIDGVKTFSSDPIIPDEAYGSGWNGVLEPPTKNAVYDKIETIVNTFKNGTTTKDAADASTTQNIAHGLGVVPKNVKIKAFGVGGGSSSGDLSTYIAETVYNGTTQSSISIHYTNSTIAGTMTTTFALATGGTGQQAGVVTFDATNIIITWTRTSSPTGSYNLLWEAFAGA